MDKSMANELTDSSSDVNPLDALAEEFLERYRRGERPALTEYTEKHPKLADEIRDLFPALVMMEDVRPGQRDVTGVYQPGALDAGPRLERVGDYRILREVGRGGMGVVYEAIQESLGRHVALKVLPGQALANPLYLERFRREARAAGRLHHTNIVPVFGTGESDGVHFYAMQFIQGQGLDLVLQDVKRLRLGKALVKERSEASIAGSLVSGQFGVAPAPRSAASSVSLTASSGFSTGSEHAYHRSVARVGLQVAEALATANKQGVLHRDVKPSNLLLDLQGNAWITDFGLAKADEGGDLTNAGDIVGTIRYMAPERFDGRSSPESDVYGLGVTLYELLTLKSAFEEPHRGRLIEKVLHEPPVSPRKLDRSIPRDLETIVLKCIAKEPKDRYATAEALAEDLRRYLLDRPIVGRRSTVMERTWRWCRRNPAVASLLTLMVLLLVAVSIASSVAALRFQMLAADEKQARHEAEKAEAAERWERYRSNIAAASAALQMENSSTARRALEAAPEVHHNWEWRHLHHQLDSASAVLRGDGGPLRAGAFSADGRRLAVTTPKGFAVHLWDPTTRDHVAVLRGHTTEVKHVAFSPDGQRLVTGGNDGLRLWNAATGTPIGPQFDPAGILTLALAPDGPHIAACTR